MSKRQLLCVFGAWIMIFLFLGFPTKWQKVIAVVSGLAVIGISYSFPAPSSAAPSETRETFVENKQ